MNFTRRVFFFTNIDHCRCFIYPVEIMKQILLKIQPFYTVFHYDFMSYNISL